MRLSGKAEDGLIQILPAHLVTLTSVALLS
jgi:hypothetical protein